MDGLGPNTVDGRCSEAHLASFHKRLLGVAVAMILVQSNPFSVVDDGLFPFYEWQHSPSQRERERQTER